MKNRIIYVLLLSAVSAAVSHPELHGAERHTPRADSTARSSIRISEYHGASRDAVSRWFDNQPAFGIYKDNYFVTGIPTNHPASPHTADAKFQVSIHQRLTKTVLPFNTFLMFVYTQKSFWDIYEKSSPFDDLNYNPGLLLGKPIIAGNKLRGMVSLSIEHESNGKDSTDSRSWNYFVINGSYRFGARFSMQLKSWPGWAGSDNPDIYKYRGYGSLAIHYRNLRDWFQASVVINPRDGFRSYNTQIEANFKVNPGSNQYIFLQWYNGYGESLLEYNRYTSMVRAGFCIKPHLRNLY